MFFVLNVQVVNTLNDLVACTGTISVNRSLVRTDVRGANGFCRLRANHQAVPRHAETAGCPLWVFSLYFLLFLRGLRTSSLQSFRLLIAALQK